jgi:hypothetical protein
MLALTIQTIMFTFFALAASLFFTAQLYKLIRRNKHLVPAFVFFAAIVFQIALILN